jgi:hypothetical protein
MMKRVAAEKGYAMLLMLLVVIAIGVIIWYMQLKSAGGEGGKPEAQQTAESQADQEAYERTMGKYGFTGGGDQ